MKLKTRSLLKKVKKNKSFKKIALVSSLILAIIMITTAMKFVVIKYTVAQTEPRVKDVNGQIVDKNSAHKNYFLVLYNYFSQGQRELHQIINNI